MSSQPATHLSLTTHRSIPHEKRDRDASSERLYAGLLKLAALPDHELRALVASLLADTQDA
jgi:hypothetical protein